MPEVTLKEITQIVRLQLGAPQVNESDRLMEDLDAESVDIANIVAALEARYNIQVQEAEIASLVTVSDLLALVNHLL